MTAPTNDILGQAPTSAGLSDTRLLQQVSDGQREAFDELYRRYAVKALSIAQHLTRNQALAEDAVQEAFTALWRRAGKFDIAQGQVSAWIMGIVARSSLRLARKHETDRVRDGCAPSPSPAPAPGTLPGFTEELAALRAALGRLSGPQRRCIALYYGAELTQHQIAEIAGCSQRKVSRVLADALERMRGELTRSGLLSGLAPLLAKEPLQQALTTGATPSAQLLARCREGLAASPGAAEGSLPGRGGPARSWTMPLLAAGVGVALLAAWPFVWGPGSRNPAHPPEGNVQALPSAGSAPGLETASTFRLHWDFDTPEAGGRDLKLPGKEAWRWAPNAGWQGTGCLEMTGEYLWMEILPTLPARPLAVSLRMRMSPKSSYNMVLFRGPLERRAAFHHGHHDFASPGWKTLTSYVAGAFTDLWLDGTQVSVRCRLEGAETGLWIGISGRGFLDELEIRSVPPGELPNYEPYRKILDAIPPSRRQGTLRIPGHPGQGGRDLEVLFLPTLSVPESAAPAGPDGAAVKE